MNGLKQLATEYRAHTFSEVTLVGPKEGLDHQLSQTESLALFHICQESLANAAKHSNAKRVDIKVWMTSERVIMEIRDNGRGFDLEKMTMTLGHGLSNIQTRARSVGGEVDITSVIGEGTTILAWVPRRALA